MELALWKDLERNSCAGSTHWIFPSLTDFIWSTPKEFGSMSWRTPELACEAANLFQKFEYDLWLVADTGIRSVVSREVEYLKAIRFAS